MREQKALAWLSVSASACHAGAALQLTRAGSACGRGSGRLPVLWEGLRSTSGPVGEARVDFRSCGRGSGRLPVLRNTAVIFTADVRESEEAQYVLSRKD